MALHRKYRGKLQVASPIAISSQADLSISYTPGVAEPCRVIAQNPDEARNLTIKGNSVAIVTNGSAVLGLGNIGALAALPVMEGKALLMREFAQIDAWPICLELQDADSLVSTIKALAPSFGGINLEDIAAPLCFEVEERLQDLGIPVFHDDQHGTAIVTIAALINSCRLTGQKLEDLKIIMNGAGAAGIAISRLLNNTHLCEQLNTRPPEIILCDSTGAVSRNRTGLNSVKQKALEYTNPHHKDGSLKEIIRGAQVFIGVSQANLLTAEMVQTMSGKPIIFAMANPVPEITPDEAHKGGAFIVGTGRSDFPNQINNLLAFPGIFRGALDANARAITDRAKAQAAIALAKTVSNPSPDYILPNALDRSVVPAVAAAVAEFV